MREIFAKNRVCKLFANAIKRGKSTKDMEIRSEMVKNQQRHTLSFVLCPLFVHLFSNSIDTGLGWCTSHGPPCRAACQASTLA